MQSTIYRSATIAVRANIRAAMFLCVLVSLWQGPIPWLHSHADGSTTHDGSLLTQHAEVWHELSDRLHSEWHVHFALLSDIVRGAGCPVPPESDDTAPTLLTVVVSVDHVETQTVTAWPESILPGTTLAAVEPPASAEPAARRQFLADFTAADCLQVLLCIARC